MAEIALNESKGPLKQKTNCKLEIDPKHVETHLEILQDLK